MYRLHLTQNLVHHTANMWGVTQMGVTLQRTKTQGESLDGAQAPGGFAAWQLQRDTLCRNHILLRKSPGRPDMGAGVHKES